MSFSNRELHGTDMPLEAEIVLKAGPFVAVFEPSRGYLREVRVNWQIAVRNVYVHVRAPEWETIVPVVTMTEQKIGSDHFFLSWKGVHRQGEVDFVWFGSLSGSPDGILYTCEGEALRSFRTNRTSLCVLIPGEFKGLDAEIGHSDGSKTNITLPLNIDPQQPLRGMHELTAGPVKLTFEGAAFDAEDQRNWTDASFKAYPTSSNQPVTGMKKGDKIAQSVRIEPVKWEAPRVRVMTPNSRPMIGATINDDHGDLGSLSVDFLRVELPKDPTRASYLLEHARSVGVPLHVVVQKGAAVPDLQPSDVLIALDAAAAPKVQGPVWLGGGEFFSFNMGRHSAAGFDGIEVNGTPQIHTFDERSILDNAASLCDVARSLSSIAPNAQIGLNIQMKGDGHDPRLLSMFGAVWLLRSFAALCPLKPTWLTLGTTDELQFPILGHLLKELRLGTASIFLGESTDADIVVLQRKSILVGNLRRTPRCVGLAQDISEAHVLTANGWKRRLNYDSQIGPYEIIRLRIRPRHMGI